MEEKYKELLSWIDDVLESKKVSILMNDHISGFIASKIASNKVGKDNVVNVIIPCYSNTEYILTSALFSNEQGIKYKSIGIKHVFDSIMEKDIEDDEPIDITNILRGHIMEEISLKNKSVVFEFVKKEGPGWWKANGNYAFRIIVPNNEQDVIWESDFTEEELVEFSKYLGING